MLESLSHGEINPPGVYQPQCCRMESLSLLTAWLSVLLAKDMESTNGRISSVQCYQTNGQLLCTAETAIIGNGPDLDWVNIPDQQDKTGIEKS